MAKFFRFMLISWFTAFLISFVNALYMWWILEATDVPALEDLGYWQLYWLSLAFVVMVSSGTTMAITLRREMDKEGYLV